MKKILQSSFHNFELKMAPKGKKIEDVITLVDYSGGFFKSFVA